MYQALYRKYRPMNFDDVCGQDHITSVLKTQLQKGRVSHAYLFCGSRGTGKTTCAKILARAVNCQNPQNGEPCNQCDSCLAIQKEKVLDVVEMDAASNNGIDHIRTLCDEVQFLPSEAKKRVYIMDEVHMLSNQAFNALLKTIEEPPEHVLFILATTEVNEIPATILSRCQRFDFKRITPEIITERLVSIAREEKILIDEKACAVIARLSDGAMRDALSLLEACQGYHERIDADAIHRILGLGDRSLIFGLARSLAVPNAARVLDQIAQIYEKHGDFKEMISELIAVYRDLMIIKTVEHYERYLECYENEVSTLAEIASLHSKESLSYQSELLEDYFARFDQIPSEKKTSFEILAMRMCMPGVSNDATALAARVASLEKRFSDSKVVIRPREEEKQSSAVCNAAHALQEEPQKKSLTDDEPTAGANAENLAMIKNALQKEQMIKHWLPQIDLEIQNDTLILCTGAFIGGILGTSENKKMILDICQKAGAGIEDVMIRIQSVAKKEKSDLEDL